jgi:hypothetical protein
MNPADVRVTAQPVGAVAVAIVAGVWTALRRLHRITARASRRPAARRLRRK